jgi:hypothetical protein
MLGRFDWETVIALGIATVIAVVVRIAWLGTGKATARLISPIASVFLRLPLCETLSLRLGVKPASRVCVADLRGQVVALAIAARIEAFALCYDPPRETSGAGYPALAAMSFLRPELTEALGADASRPA